MYDIKMELTIVITMIILVVAFFGLITMTVMSDNSVKLACIEAGKTLTSEGGCE